MQIAAVDSACDTILAYTAYRMKKGLEKPIIPMDKMPQSPIAHSPGAPKGSLSARGSPLDHQDSATAKWGSGLAKNYATTGCIEELETASSLTDGHLWQKEELK